MGVRITNNKIGNKIRTQYMKVALMGGIKRKACAFIFMHERVYTCRHTFRYCILCLHARRQAYAFVVLAANEILHFSACIWMFDARAGRRSARLLGEVAHSDH